MLQGEHSAILSTFIKLPFVINIFVLSIFEQPLKTGFTEFQCLHLPNKEYIHLNVFYVIVYKWNIHLHLPYICSKRSSCPYKCPPSNFDVKMTLLVGGGGGWGGGVVCCFFINLKKASLLLIVHWKPYSKKNLSSKIENCCPI